MMSHEHLMNLGMAYVYNAKQIYVNGVRFCKSFFVVLETSYTRLDNLLLFGCIEEIVLLGDKVYRYTLVVKTINFDTSVHAYEVSLDYEDKTFRFIETKFIKFYKPFRYWTKPGSE